MTTVDERPATLIRREEPPPPAQPARPYTTRRSKLTPLADELRARPGEWWVVYEGPVGKATGMATHIRLGQMACFAPSGDFDATTRLSNGVTVVYARYVGDEAL